MLLSFVKSGAQECKPIRANRARKPTVAPLKYIASAWTDYRSGYRVESRRTGWTRFVTVRNGDALVDSFNINAQDEAVAPYFRYRVNGEDHIDPLNAQRSRIARDYFDGAFHSSHVTSTFIPARRTVIYYGGLDGRVSVRIARHENGVFQKKIVYNASGADTLTMEWNTEGILILNKTRA